MAKLRSMKMKIDKNQFPLLKKEDLEDKRELTIDEQRALFYCP